LRNRKVSDDACGEINGADVIVAVVVVVVAAVAFVVIIAGITSPRYIRSGPKRDNTPRKGFTEINLPSDR